jgi:glucokinase
MQEGRHYNLRVMPTKKKRASKKKMPAGLLLAGDIGATKTKVALFDPRGDLREARNVQTFLGEDYPGGLVPALREYLKENDETIMAACFGAAGPVVDDQVHLTNLDWTIDAAELCDEFGFRAVWLMNDLKAIANAVPILKPNELHTLNVGIPEEHGTIAVLAPGTGLGVGYLNWAAGRYHAYATEGGHANFAPADELQDEMIVFLRRKLGQVAVEHACAGVGIPNVYEFLKESGKAEEPEWLAKELAGAEDVPATIFENGLDRKPGSELCQMTLAIFVTVLAAEASNMALGLGSTGGVYVGGGIPPRILPALERYDFMKTFFYKPKYEDYLARFPVHVILNVESGLLGAAEYGRQQLLQLEGV